MFCCSVQISMSVRSGWRRVIAVSDVSTRRAASAVSVTNRRILLTQRMTEVGRVTSRSTGWSWMATVDELAALNHRLSGLHPQRRRWLRRRRRQEGQQPQREDIGRPIDAVELGSNTTGKRADVKVGYFIYLFIMKSHARYIDKLIVNKKTDIISAT